MKGIWIVGTGTDIGKTLITTSLLRLIQQKNINVVPYKPIQSGAYLENEMKKNPDVEFYKTYSSSPLKDKELNTYGFLEPASPHFAASLENIEIDETLIYEHLQMLEANYDFIICEGAGGVCVPLNNEKLLLIDIIQETNYPVIIVADAKLGTINHTLLTIESLHSRGISIDGIILNSFTNTEIEKNNALYIHNFSNLVVHTVPYLPTISTKTIDQEIVPVLHSLLFKEERL